MQFKILSGNRTDGSPITFPIGMNPTTESPEDWMLKRQKKGVSEIVTRDEHGEELSWYLYRYGASAGKITSTIIN